MNIVACETYVTLSGRVLLCEQFQSFHQIKEVIWIAGYFYLRWVA